MFVDGTLLSFAVAAVGYCYAILDFDLVNFLTPVFVPAAVVIAIVYRFYSATNVIVFYFFFFFNFLNLPSEAFFEDK